MTLAQTNCVTNTAPRTTPIALLAKWIDLARQRRGLAALTHTQLHDIGLSTDEAKQEANRPFWDVPHHWRH